MSFDIKTNTAEQQNDTFEHRYKVIESLNEKSFYMTNPHRSFDVFMSAHNTGGYREEYTPATAAKRLIRQEHLLSGNVSDLGTYGPSDMTPEERAADGKANMARFFEQIGIPKENVYVLNPERDYDTPLTIVNADEQKITEETVWPVRLDQTGDFVYTRNPNKVLAGRPADCPILFASADTPEGRIYILVHYAWKGAAHHYVAQTADAFDVLGVDRTSLEIYLTPGAQAENFPFTHYPRDPREEYPNTEGLFVNVQENGDETWNFDIDTPHFVYSQVIEQLGIDPKQVFCDTSDTASLESGYSSHGRSMRLKEHGENNTRDIVVATFNK